MITSGSPPSPVSSAPYHLDVLRKEGPEVIDGLDTSSEPGRTCWEVALPRLSIEPPAELGVEGFGFRV